MHEYYVYRGPIGHANYIGSVYAPTIDAALVAARAQYLIGTEPLPRAGQSFRAGDPVTRDPYHSSDFQLIIWNGQRYTLSPKQRLVVKRLWEAWERGRPEVEQSALVRAADSEATRLLDLFRNSDAWGTLIVRVGTSTLYRLAPIAGEEDVSDDGADQEQPGAEE